MVDGIPRGFVLKTLIISYIKEKNLIKKNKKKIKNNNLTESDPRMTEQNKNRVAPALT